MTDRIHSVTVVFDRDVREDDAESIIDAIRMIKRVASVTANVSNVSDHVAYERARRELEDRLWKALRQEGDDHR